MVFGQEDARVVFVNTHEPLVFGLVGLPDATLFVVLVNEENLVHVQVRPLRNHLLVRVGVQLVRQLRRETPRELRPQKTLAFAARFPRLAVVARAPSPLYSSFNCRPTNFVDSIKKPVLVHCHVRQVKTVAISEKAKCCKNIVVSHFVFAVSATNRFAIVATF
jgi:hypothetical protein